MRSGPRPRLRRLLAAAVLAAAGCGGGGDSESTNPTGGTVSGGPGKDWPIFGRVPQRTHALTNGPDPPFLQVWQLFQDVLIEFPPALHDGVLFVGDKEGNVRAIDATDGKVVWLRNFGGRDVTGPAFSTPGQDKVMVGREDGDFVALDPVSGKPVWTFRSSSPIESSPIVVGKTVVFGTDDGTVYALDVSNGKKRWSYKAAGPVKSSPSFSNGLLYFADYSGNVYAAKPLNGDIVWRTHTGSGGFYSSPAIAYGRLYAARDDGAVVALCAGSTRSEARSPARRRSSGTPFTRRASRPGPRSGSTRAPARRPSTSPSAGYTPAISDGQRVFLTGYLTIYALEPK